MSVPFEGGCRCGAIRYRCTADPAVAVHCYCRDCQYASGGARSTVLVVSRDSVAIEGAPTRFTSRADSGTGVSRMFCPTCGSPLFACNDSTPALLGIKAATLDDPTWVKPGAEIWTDSAPPWAQLTDDLPRFGRNFGGG